MANAIVSGIYKITNLDTGKCYVGSAVKIKSRWSEHRNDLKRGTHHSAKLQNAWNKYGADRFDFSILEYVADRNDLVCREQHWMDSLDCVASGYNVLPVAGSALGRVVSEETCRKISEANTGNVWTDERKAAASAARKGRPVSQSAAKKISEALRGKKRKPLTELHRARIGAKSKGRSPSAETRMKLSKAITGIKRPPPTDEARANMSEAHKGKNLGVERPQEVKDKIAAAVREWHRLRKLAKDQQATQ